MKMCGTPDADGFTYKDFVEMLPAALELNSRCEQVGRSHLDAVTREMDLVYDIVGARPIVVPGRKPR